MNSKDMSRQTLLYYSVDISDLQIAEILIRSGAEVNKHDRKGDTPLHCAGSRG